MIIAKKHSGLITLYPCPSTKGYFPIPIRTSGLPRTLAVIPCLIPQNNHIWKGIKSSPESAVISLKSPWILNVGYYARGIRLISRNYFETEPYFPKLSTPTHPTGGVSTS